MNYQVGNGVSCGAKVAVTVISPAGMIKDVTDLFTLSNTRLSFEAVHLSNT